MVAAFAYGGTGDASNVDYSLPPAIHRRAPVEAKPLPFREVGTGGVGSQAFYISFIGYRPFLIVDAPPAFDVQDNPDTLPFAKLMQEVKAGFGRTMVRLPEVFGVSRQTLYNWLDGETPKPAHQERLKQLAEAARVFSNTGLKPTSILLDRTVAQGKSLLQLLKEGADGRETATKLMRIAKRGAESRAKLDAVVGTRKADLEAGDFGAASFQRDA